MPVAPCRANFFFRDLGLIRPASVLNAVTAGFESAPKSLPAWLLYDARGAQLFDSFAHAGLLRNCASKPPY